MFLSWQFWIPSPPRNEAGGRLLKEIPIFHLMTSSKGRPGEVDTPTALSL